MGEETVRDCGACKWFRYGTGQYTRKDGTEATVPLSSGTCAATESEHEETDAGCEKWVSLFQEKGD